MTKLLVGSATDVGLVRTNNQDQLLVSPGLYAVADGMGGHAAGEVASSTAVRALQAAFEAGEVHTAESLESATKAANRAVWEQARTNRGMLGMGTTLVAVAVVETDDGTSGLAVAHVGDSRLYLLRDHVLHQLTVDHSLVQELIDDGQITPAQAAIHPQRHVLTRALGVEPSVDVDLIDISPRHGDRYILCSDGLPREASDDQITAVAERFADPSEAARQLVALANARGGSDNVTVVVIDVLANDGGPGTLLVVPGATTSPGRTGPGAPATRPVMTRNVATGTGGGGPGDGGTADGTTAAGTTVDVVTADGGSADGGSVGSGAAGYKPTPTLGTRRERPPHEGRRLKWLTWRAAGFVLALAALVGGALGCLAWYARSAYYVTLLEGRIDILQGRPGGVLWFQPTLAARTGYTSASVLSYNLPTLQAGQVEPSLKQAHLYISRLVSEKTESEGVTPPAARGAPRHGAKGVATSASTTSTAPASAGHRPAGAGEGTTASRTSS